MASMGGIGGAAAFGAGGLSPLDKELLKLQNPGTVLAVDRTTGATVAIAVEMLASDVLRYEVVPVERVRHLLGLLRARRSDLALPIDHILELIRGEESASAGAAAGAGGPSALAASGAGGGAPAVRRTKSKLDELSDDLREVIIGQYLGVDEICSRLVAAATERDTAVMKFLTNDLDDETTREVFLKAPLEVLRFLLRQPALIARLDDETTQALFLRTQGGGFAVILRRYYSHLYARITQIVSSEAREEVLELMLRQPALIAHLDDEMTQAIFRDAPVEFLELMLRQPALVAHLAADAEITRALFLRASGRILGLMLREPALVAHLAADAKATRVLFLMARREVLALLLEQPALTVHLDAEATQTLFLMAVEGNEWDILVRLLRNPHLAVHLNAAVVQAIFERFPHRRNLLEELQRQFPYLGSGGGCCSIQ